VGDLLFCRPNLCRPAQIGSRNGAADCNRKVQAISWRFEALASGLPTGTHLERGSAWQESKREEQHLSNEPPHKNHCLA